MLNDTKPALHSKGVMGGALAAVTGSAAALALVLNLLGYDASEAQVEELIAAGLALISAASGVVSALGRIRATKRIG